MDCPRCHAAVNADALSCPECRLDLSVIRSFSDIQAELRQAKQDAAGMAARFNQLEHKFESFEAQLGNWLIGQQGSTPPTAQRDSSFRADTPPPDLSEETSAISSPPEDISQSGSPPPPEPPPVTTPRPTPNREAEVRFGQKWLLIAGVGTMIVGIGFFLRYAFEQNWVGPAGRVGLAYLVALAFLGSGEFFRRKEATTFGLYLIGGGIATLYLTTFAAFQLYALIGQGLAFGFLVVATIFAGLLSLFYHTQWLAILGLVGGFATPVLLSTGQNNQIALMSYMAVLNGGVLTLAAFKQWTLLNRLGFVFTWLLFSGWYVRSYVEAAFWPTSFFLNLFFLTYALVPFMPYFWTQRPQRLTGFGISMPNAFVAFGYSFSMVRETFSVPAVTLVSLSYAGVFFVLANLLYRLSDQQAQPDQQANREAFVLMLTLGLLFLVISVPLLFSGHWITVFWAAQAVVMLWAASRLGNQRLYVGGSVVLLLAVGKFLAYDYEHIFSLRTHSLSYARGFARLWFERWITTAVVLGALFWSARMLKTAMLEAQKWPQQIASVLFGLFGLLCFMALNFEVGGFFYDYARQARFAAISVLWTLFAIGLMALGFLKNHVFLRQCAIGLFAATGLKVVVWDMANASTPFRIISFIVLGLVLIGASYLYHHYRSYILPPESQPKEAA